MFSPFWNKFVEWLFRKENRHLVIPWAVCTMVVACYASIIVAYLTLEKPSVRSFLEWFFDHRLLLAGGGLLIFSGLIYGWYLRDKKGILIGAVPLISVGLIGMIVGFVTIPRLPQDQFVVAVVRFTPVGKAADEKEAGVFPSRIRDELAHMFRDDPLVKIKFFQDVRIEGNDEGEMRSAAEKLCDKIPAHMIVWGEVRIEDGALTLAPVVTRSPQVIAKRSRFDPSSNVSETHTPLDPFKKPESYEPPHLEFKKIVAQETADLAGFICGLIYYENRRLNEAITIFRRVKVGVAQLYMGMAYFELSWESKEPMKNLISARGIYDKILNSNEMSDPHSLSRGELFLFYSTLAAKADTLASLSEFDRPHQGLDVLREAIGTYERSMEGLSELGLREDLAWVKNNLGLALLSLGGRLGDTEGEVSLNKALKRFQEAQEIFQEFQFVAQAALTESYVGFTFGEMAQRAAPPRGKELLVSAVAAHRRASTLFSALKLSKEQAIAAINLGGALVSLSEWQDSKSAKETLREANVALSAARDTITQQEFPRYYAGLHIILGSLYCNMGIRSPRVDAMNYFDYSVTAFNAALKFFSASDFPQDWASIKNSLGISIYQSSKLLEGEQRIIALQEAEGAWRSALTIWTENTNPRAWAMAQNNLGNALRHMGTATSGKESEEMLGQATVDYREALRVRTHDTFPRESAMTEDNLGLAFTELGKRAKAEAAVHHFEEAITAFRGSLRVRTRETFPDQWADTTGNLAQSLFLMSMGLDDLHSQEALNEAVNRYKGLASFRSRKDEPTRWAIAQNDLGCALAELGRRLDSDAGLPIVQEAIDVLRTALEVRTKTDYPQDWAGSMTNLAIALNTMAIKSPEHERKGYQQESLKTYASCLTVDTETSSPENWAMIKASMGRVLIGLSLNDGEETTAEKHLNDAVDCFKEALRIWTEEWHPNNWAETQIALGMSLLSLGTRASSGVSYLNEAIKCFDSVIVSAVSLQDENLLKRATELRDLAIKAKSEGDRSQR